MIVGAKWSAGLPRGLPRVIERLDQNPDFVDVEGAGERMLCQELKH